VEMRHCKTCADTLHVIILIILTAIPYLLASCLIRLPFLRTCIPFTSPRFYALPIEHETSSKNAKLSSAATSLPWRHTNTSKNHGYNAVADDSCAGSHFVPRIRQSLTKLKVKKVENVEHFRTLHTVLSLSDEGGDLCKVWFRLVQKCELVQGTN